MIKRFLSLILVVALSVCICGCADASSAVTAVSSRDMDLTVTDDQVSIDFSWWGNDDRHNYTMNGVDLFMKENPDIAVNYHYGVWQGYEKRNRVAMNSASEADVMQINYAWLNTYSMDGDGYYDLSLLADDIALDNFSSECLSYGTKEGKLNAIPIAFNSLVFLYNEEVWDKYNLPYPKTWDDLFDAAKAMRGDGVYPLGMVKKMTLFLAIANYEQTHSRKVFDESGQLLIDASELSEIIDFYKRLVDEKVLLPVDDFDKQKLGTGEIAGSLCWISDTGNYGEIIEKAGGSPCVGGFLIEDGAKETGWYQKPSTLYAISADTEHPREAARLLNYLLNDSDMAMLQLCEKGVPTSANARNTLKENGVLSGYEYEADCYMNENIDKLNPLPTIIENEDVIDSFKSCCDEYIYAKAGLDECAMAFERAVRDIHGTINHGDAK